MTWHHAIYCIRLHYSMMHVMLFYVFSIVLYCIVLYCIVFYYVILCRKMQYIIPRHDTLCHIYLIQHYVEFVMLCCIHLHFPVYSLLCYMFGSMIHYTVSCLGISYCVMLQYGTLHYDVIIQIILYCFMFLFRVYTYIYIYIYIYMVCRISPFTRFTQ